MHRSWTHTKIENVVGGQGPIKVLMVTGVYPPDINGAVLQAKMIREGLHNSFDFKILTSPLKCLAGIPSDPNVFRIIDFSSAFKSLKTLIDLIFFLFAIGFRLYISMDFLRKFF